MSAPGRRWFEQRNDFTDNATPAGAPARSVGPEGTDTVPELFTKCRGCGEVTYNDVLAENWHVCPACGYHNRISAEERIGLLCDEGDWTRHDGGLSPIDRLGFVDSKPYTKRIAAAKKKVGRNDAYLALSAEVEGIPVEIGVLDFAYMGGSMGSVVGECITRQLERALERRVPAIIVSASGGARMQEGVLSLMQMAKTSAALANLADAGLPYISILTHPTTGGVAASFAMLGDLILAEPGAMVGFAGARVIEQTIGQELPEGFQTSEFLLDHGLVDQVVSRNELKPTLARVLRMFLTLPPAAPVAVESDEADPAEDDEA